MWRSVIYSPTGSTNPSDTPLLAVEVAAPFWRVTLIATYHCDGTLEQQLHLDQGRSPRAWTLITQLPPHGSKTPNKTWVTSGRGRKGTPRVLVIISFQHQVLLCAHSMIPEDVCVCVCAASGHWNDACARFHHVCDLLRRKQRWAEPKWTPALFNLILDK